MYSDRYVNIVGSDHAACKEKFDESLRFYLFQTAKVHNPELQIR